MCPRLGGSGKPIRHKHKRPTHRVRECLLIPWRLINLPDFRGRNRANTQILRFIQLSVKNYVNRNIPFVNDDVKIFYLLERKGIIFIQKKRPGFEPGRF